MDERELMKVGLTENEAKVYCALLDFSSTNADPIIKRTSLHRNIVYDNLSRLIKKGLAGYVIKNNRRYFEPAQSRKILDWVQERKAEILEKERLAEKLLPEIEAVRKQKSEAKEAIIIQGKKGVVSLLLELVDDGDFDMFASGYGLRVLFPLEYVLFNNRIRQCMRKVRAIISNKHRTKDQGASINRFLSDVYEIPVNTSITRDKVVIFIFDKDPLAIQIRSKEVAASYQRYFNALWKVAKP